MRSINWRASTLLNNFERTVIGFDLRKCSAIESYYLTSYDEDIRYEEIYENSQEFQTGMGLFWMMPSTIQSLIIPKSAQLLAFDLPSSFVEALSISNVSNPQPVQKNELSINWKFIGFDIADAYTQTSAFHGFDFSKFELMKILHENHISQNKYKLIDTAETAIRSASIFDDLLPEHGPFSPVGIWLKLDKDQ